VGLILAADVGTTNVKAGLVNESGRVVSVADRPVPLERREPGAAEHHPDRLFGALAQACRKAVGNRGSSVEAIVLSSYHMGLMALDASLRPLTGMSTILDTRSRETFGELAGGHDLAGIYRRTGCPPFAQYTLAKIYWMRRRRREVFRKARHLWGSKDYLLWRLTGRAVTEPSLAAATQLMNIRTLKWDRVALKTAGVDEGLLAPIVRSDAPMGGVGSGVAGLLGVRPGTPVVPGVYDGGALIVGVGGLASAVGVMNLGTSAMIRVVTPRPVLDRHMRLQAHVLFPGAWIPGEGLNNAGNAIAWVMRMTGIGSFRELEELAKKVRFTGDGPFFYPYLTGERDPRIGSYAHGVLLGLKERHGRADLALAVLEGIGYTLRLVAGALAESGVRAREIRAGGGGARMPFWVGMLADILGVPVRTSGTGHPSLVGSGMIGFVATGRYGSLEMAARRMVRLNHPVRPDHRTRERHEARFGAFSRGLGTLAEFWRA
jgi:gluconokinase